MRKKNILISILTIATIMVVVLFCFKDTKANVVDFEPDTKYTLNEYFGEGDYQYFDKYLNEYFNTNNETTYTPKQLASVTTLNFENTVIIDFPNDLSILSSISSITLDNVSGLSKLGFIYKNSNSMLVTVEVRNSNDLVEISNNNIDFKSYNESEYQEQSANFINLPNLEIFENNTFKDVAIIYFDFENITSNIQGLMYEDTDLNSEKDEGTNFIKNVQNNRKTYSDLSAQADFAAVRYNNNTYVSNNISITIRDSSIESLTDIENNTINYYISRSIIKDFTLKDSRNTETFKSLNFDFNSVYLENMDISEYLVADQMYIYLYKVSVENISDIYSNGVTLFVDSSRISKLGLINSSNVNIKNTYNNGVYLNDAFIDEFKGIDINYEFSEYASYNQINIRNSQVNTIGAINSTIVANPKLRAEAIPSNIVEIYTSNIDRINYINLEIKNNQTNIGVNIFNIENVNIKEIGNSNLAASTNAFKNLDSKVDIIGNLILEGDNSTFNTNSIYGFNTIGDISLNKVKNSNNTNQKNELSIYQNMPITSIGNVRIEGNNGYANSIFSIDNNILPKTKITKIGSMFLEDVIDLDLSAIGLQEVGLIDTPILESIKLNDNQLVKLDVKNNEFTSSLKNYDFNGNQIVGNLPINNKIREEAKYLNNYFNINQDNITKQSSLVLNYDGNKYYSHDLEKLNTDNILQIELEYDEVFDLSNYTSNISLYNENTEQVLFDNHIWTYEVINNGKSKSNSLIEGENLVAIMLNNAAAGAKENNNAKIFVNVNLAPKITTNVPGTINTPENNVNKPINLGQDTIVQTGQSIPKYAIILLGLMPIIAFAYMLNKKEILSSFK